MQPQLVRHGGKLAAAIIVGIVAGLLVWPFVQFRGWPSDRLGTISLIYSIAVPVLSIAGMANVVANVLLVLDRSTRSFASKWLLLSVLLWIASSGIVLGVYKYYGPVQHGLMQFVAGSMYVGSAASFGLIIAPLYLITAMQTAFAQRGM